MICGGSNGLQMCRGTYDAALVRFRPIIRWACIQLSYLYLGSDADNAEDRARRFRQPYLPDIPDGKEPLEQRLRAALYSDFVRLQLEFARSGKEHSRAWDGANYAILEIPTLDPLAPARYLVHECMRRS